MTASTTHLAILPAYNTGPRLREIAAEALRHWRPVLVVIDGSTDGSGDAVRALAEIEPELTVLVLPRNVGKGGAVLAGARAATDRGFTHALVMDADGQHPASSIGEFMEASRRNPGALVLGRPIFPDNIPAERRHGRKLSIGLVRLELLGGGVADPLFGFRVYPLRELLAVLEPRRGGRRYDFDTEAAVRLCWAGVTPLNLAAPVRYFSRAEGGVSHFHYVRDNLALAWMHTRLITELVLRRWPGMLRVRRRWREIGVAVGLLCLCALPLGAAEADPLVNPEHQLAAGAPGWADLAERFAHPPDTTADFVERRYFPYKKEPVELTGEVRVSAQRGLSLHYTTPEVRTVILDSRGLLLRSASGEKAPASDPRAAAANDALRHILFFDFAALEKDFTLYGQRDAGGWTLALVPRSEAVRRSMARITVTGDATTVRTIELRRSTRQYVEIRMAAPRAPAAFSEDQLKKYFR